MLESPALIARLYDVAVVREAVEQRRGHLGVAEDAAPFREGEVGGGQQTSRTELDPTLQPYVAYGLEEAKRLS